MTKQRTTHALLAVVVALLGLHLALRLSPQEATAQPGPPVEPPVQAVSIVADKTSFNGHQQIYRLWSDGTVEWNRVNIVHLCPSVSNTSWCGWETVPE